MENFKKLHRFDKNIEFLIGLDGCNDKTKEIIRGYKFVKCLNMGKRNGKHKVINKLMQKARGDIIVIHDADWIFNVLNKDKLVELKNEFKDKKLGGIAEAYPIEYPAKKNTKSLGHLGSMWGNYFWIDFQKKHYTYKEGSRSYAKYSKNSFPFLVNIFRKDLYNKNTTLGDDFERGLDILNKEYKVLIVNDLNFPRMISAYKTTRFKDIARQKERTSLARKQVFKKYKLNISIFNFYLPLLLHSLRNVNKIGNSKEKMAFFVWLFTFGLGTVKNKIFETKSTKEGWLMRAKR